MSWATRRRIAYLTGVLIFLGIVVGGPVAYHFLTIPPTCHDGVQNQGESAIDEGGPCLILNQNDLQPQGVLWARAFLVRPGITDAVAYIDNPNQNAGIVRASYELDLYDDKNALIQNVMGNTFILPQGVTPVFAGNISTGNRFVKYAQFKLTGPLTWERLLNVAAAVKVSNIQTSVHASSTQLTAIARNSSVTDIDGLTFVATVFDPGGNAIATSQTALRSLPAGQSTQIFFTWPFAFTSSIGNIDIVPLAPPLPDPAAQR